MRLRNTILTAGILFTASDARAARMCLPCMAGYYLNSDTNSQCRHCAAGTYQDEMGKGSCKPCPAGTYQDNTGQVSCKPCGTIATTGKTYCPVGTNTTDWSCRSSALGGSYQYSGYFGEAYKTNNGGHCHCRRKDQTGAWSSWVFIYDRSSGGCSGACGSNCAEEVASKWRWGDTVRW
jgi:hypothetical protein